jgi:acylphosphatase
VHVQTCLQSIFSDDWLFAEPNLLRYKVAMGSDAERTRMHALFSGRVQGVGFRFAVCRIADKLEVTGFVRNLWDGDVEIIAEGTQRELSEFLHQIRNSPLRRHIERDAVSWKKPTGEFEQFGVSF